MFEAYHDAISAAHRKLLAVRRARSPYSRPYGRQRTPGTCRERPISPFGRLFGFGLEVWATDLWIAAEDNARRIEEAGVRDRVFPIHADAHALPFAESFFDAVISVGAYHYFGTDDLYLGYVTRFIRPGGRLGISLPGLTEEPETLPPVHLEPFWHWDFCAWHSPAWWRRHWEKTGLVTVEVADLQPDGWRDWLRWNDACDRDRGVVGSDANMLRTDAGRLLGLARVVGQRESQSS